MIRTVFLVGPTAVGKSAVAGELARRLTGEIVSADSMQVYRGLDIGTAKPTPAERQAVRHHLLDVCEPTEPFDVKRFVDLAQATIRSIHQRGQSALIVGGTGLYIRALRRGLFTGPSRNAELRAKLEMMSPETLFAELQRVDPATAATIDRHNPRRLVRALEVFYTAGKPISELQREWGAETRATPDACPAAPAFCLTRDRADLTTRIERRIDAQLAAGWLAEVARLAARKDVEIRISASLPAWQAAGYRELAAQVRGELSLPQAVALVKIKTRQLAKRQLTWFRREPDLTWIEVGRDEPPSTTAARIMRLLERRDEVTA